MQKGFISENHFDKEGLINSLDQINIGFEKAQQIKAADVLLNGVNIESKIRTLEVSSFVSFAYR